MNAARSRASGSRSTSRSVLIGAGGQATGPSSVMPTNQSAGSAAIKVTDQPNGPGPTLTNGAVQARSGPSATEGLTHLNHETA